ncbi:hypothetical protein APHAL10511_005242 [Amanita phalloides]|nr:hypothetical protein APHAL10511_005242 [Amanita phalloides]
MSTPSPHKQPSHPQKDDKLEVILDATKPFDSSAKADIILRTSNAVDFFVIKLLLSSVSTVFDSMIAMTVDSETRNGLPVIAVPEGSKLLRQLLILVYAHYDEQSDFDDINLCHLGMMARKYGMEIFVKNRLKRMITIPQLGPIDSFRVYITAIHLVWNDLKEVAAQETWDTPLKDLAHHAELRDITGAQLYRYLAYRFKRNQPPLRADKAASSSTSLLAMPHLQKVNPVDNAPLFDWSSQVDIALRSSDLIDFFVIKSFLIFVSPHFDEIISQTQPTEKATTKNGLNIFTVTENSRTLRQLLLLIYPSIEEAHLDTLEAYFDVRAAANKYKMSIVNHKLENLMLSSLWIREQPLRVYALSIRFGWQEAAKAAALNTLAKPLQDTTYVEELQDITGEDLYHLIGYRFRCAHAACSIVDTADPGELYEKGHIVVPKKIPYKSYPELDMTDRYLSGARGKLANCPRGSVLSENFELESAALKQFTSSQIPSRLSKLLTCRDALALAVDEAVSKIPLNPGTLRTRETALA